MNIFFWGNNNFGSPTSFTELLKYILGDSYFPEYFNLYEHKAPFGYLDFKSKDFTFLFNENSVFLNLITDKDLKIEFESFITMNLK